MELDYRFIFKEFNRLKIDYLVVGGLAVNFHGIPRLTYDIDLMISLDPDNILKLINKLSEWGYKPKAPIDAKELADENKRASWIRDKGMKAVNFYAENLPLGEIDVLLDSPVPYRTLRERAVAFIIDGEKVPTVSIHDLIDLKLKAGRKQDLSDVDHLKTILEK
jgi:hypothetical protein